MPDTIRKMTPLFQVFDMPSSLRFYRDVLGFEIIQTSGEEGDEVWWAQLRLGEAVLMLNTAYEAGERPETPDPSRVAGHGDTALYFDYPDVDGIYAHLRGRGVPVEEPVTTHYGARQLLLKDPDGYGLCFQWFAPESDRTHVDDSSTTI